MSVAVPFEPVPLCREPIGLTIADTDPAKAARADLYNEVRSLMHQRSAIEQRLIRVLDELSREQLPSPASVRLS